MSWVALDELKSWLECLPHEDLFYEVHVEIVDYRERPEAALAFDLDLRGWSMAYPVLLMGGDAAGEV